MGNNQNKANAAKPNQSKQQQHSSWSNWVCECAKCAEIPSKRRFTDKTFAYFDWTRPVVCAQWAQWANNGTTPLLGTVWLGLACS